MSDRGGKENTHTHTVCHIYIYVYFTSLTSTVKPCVCVFTVVAEWDLLVVVVIKLQTIEADVVRVTPRRQELQLKNNCTRTHTRAVKEK